MGEGGRVLGIGWLDRLVEESDGIGLEGGRPGGMVSG